VLGASGLLGSSLKRLDSVDAEIVVNVHKSWDSSLDFKEHVSCNLSEVGEIIDTLRRLRIDVVVNCVGLADVDKCEQENESAQHLNTTLPANIAAACNEHGAHLVHISTDHFGTSEKGIMREDDEIDSFANIYAKTKYQGERRVMDSCRRSSIVRCSFFCHEEKRNSLMTWIVDSLRAGREIYMFKDVYFTPVHAVQVWEAVFALVMNSRYGIYNVASRCPISKYEFGKKIATHIGIKEDLIIGVSYDDYAHLRTNRPKNMCLDGKKLEKAVGLRFDDVETALRKYEVVK